MYLLRLDDAAENWNKENWHRMYNLLKHYNIKPIVAIIPKNEDKELIQQYPADSDYLTTITDWVESGWTPALHGFNHIVATSCGGSNPVHLRSEFAGLSLDAQREKIRKGYQILCDNALNPSVFVAPFHTFDYNTLVSLKAETDIRVISDTIARNIYYRNGFYFIPQQTGGVRSLPFSVVTFCYHPNDMTEQSFYVLESFIKKKQDFFISYDRLAFKNRKLDLIDTILVRSYFFIRRARTGGDKD